ncbi:helix-turn-helix domain-containing protein [Streptomyces sp. 4F14]|uniref:helix-turn-helix domain-containing protein n=1 Tax=Streptomyces sp. 4F14 TaxID=3394380 RepID=UPI003A882AD8
MPTNTNPTVRRRRLGLELRKLRESKNMTAEQVAKRLLVSQSKISRLENGRRSISPRDVRDLCGVYEIEDERMVESLMQMARESRQQGWWYAFKDVPYSVYIGLEDDASSLRVYEPQLVTGLLQTPEYAEAVVRGGAPESSEEEIGKRVEVRLRRQGRLGEQTNSVTGELKEAIRLWLVLDEACLRRVVGGRRIMREQLEFLVDQAKLPHVTIQVLPFGVGSHTGINGQYAILEFAELADSSVVYIEGVTSDLYLEKPHEVQKYSLMYEHLRAQSLNPEESIRMIQDLAKEYAH